MAVRILNARAWNITVNDEVQDLQLNIGASTYTDYLNKEQLEKIGKSDQVAALIAASDISFDENNATVEELGFLSGIDVALTAAVYVVHTTKPTYAPVGALCLDIDAHKLWVNDPLGVIWTIVTTPTAAGTDYTAGDILTITEGGALGGRVLVRSVSAVGAVTLISLYQAGQAYTVAAGKATTGGTGTGCTIEVATISTGSGWAILN